MIYLFKEKEIPNIAQIGGKAKALMETTQVGLPVPEGFVLSVDFFEEWLDTVKSSEVFADAMKETTKEACDAVKLIAEKMVFTESQDKAFYSALDLVSSAVYAVRSSSPEEDLEGTSFAGMYETYLGTKPGMLKETIAKAFSSCFDYRVMAYKKQNGLDLTKTSIAIIIQKQIASDVSGVGFSLNPLNNCFDEVVINSSFGLGEAVVSGIVTPDMYTYDIVEKKLLEKKINSKEIGLWLNSKGGIEEKENADKTSESLTLEQVETLSDLIKICEKHYGYPVDTEWAYSGDKLYLLQARPITTYFPMFKDLLTEPGKNKRFYIDVIALTQGFDEPMSVLGMELWSNMLTKQMSMMTPGKNGSTPAIYGKEYYSMTALQKVLGKNYGLKFLNNYDGNIKKIFDGIDMNAHPFEGKVEGTEKTKGKMFKYIVTMMAGVLRGIFGNYDKGVKTYLKTSENILMQTEKLTKTKEFSIMANDALNIMTKAIGTPPIIFTGMISKASMDKIFEGEDVQKELSAMNMDLDGNPTSEMGHLLFAMASHDNFRMIRSREAFIDKVSARNFSDPFLCMLDEFMEKYSARGFKEIDVASKRIYEDVGMLYDKLIEINIEENQMLNVKKKREEAYNKLLKVAKAKGKEKKFVKETAKMKATFGYREHPKYLIVMIISKLHSICLEIADKFVVDGRLDKTYDIFDLKTAEIDRAQKDPSFDLRVAREINLSGYIESNNWPLVIDSRGKIYRPKLDVNDGDYQGDAIAPGKVVGKAKVLHSPYEKPLNSGEILIVKFTEPSWTPIFTNAAGVIMEVGGPLQHGGIIAREYGIPCVSGLMGIMDVINDGDLIEVDGYNGIVKVLKSDIDTSTQI